MVGLVPMEARAAGYENFLFTKQIKSEFFIIGDVEFIGVKLRENVKCRFWFLCGNAGNRIQSFINIVSLFIYSSAGLKNSISRLSAAESGLNNALSGNIGAKAHR